MSEEGSEPDLKSRRFNVAEVPTADIDFFGPRSRYLVSSSVAD
jgi:hypothetical protein